MVLVVEDYIQEGIVHTQCAVILDKAQLSELVHKEIDPGPRRADHVLAHMGDGYVQFIFLSKIR
jgi:hypothetical protein